MGDEWFSEAGVVEALCKHLLRQGWSIGHVAGSSREHGAAVSARRGETTLVIVARGYPPAVHAGGPRAGERRHTRPTLLARRWFDGALAATIIQQGEDPAAVTAIALPEFVTYRKRLTQTRHALDRLGIHVFVIGERGRVEIITPADCNPL